MQKSNANINFNPSSRIFVDDYITSGTISKKKQHRAQAENTIQELPQFNKTLIPQANAYKIGAPKMQVTVRYFTVLRELTEKKQDIIELQNEKTTILKLLNLLSTKYGKSFRDYVFDLETGKVKGFLQFFVNGQSSTALKGIETDLKDGDMVAIVPPVGGG